MGNRFGFNQPGFNAGEQFIESRTFSPDQPYILQLRNDSGDFLYKIEGHTKGEWRETINSAGYLSFTIPLDGDLAQTGSFKYPNRVWIHDSTAKLLRQYVVIKTRSDTIKGTLMVECAGLMHILDQEWAPAATIAETLYKFEDQIITYLANQENANPIKLGYIHPSIGNLQVISGFTEDMTIYAALMTFWKRYGGVITIDSSGRLNWDTDDLDGARYTMTLYEDIEKYEYTVDSDSVINRIYPRGKIYYDGTTHRRRSVGAGYVEDTDSQAIYGVRPKRILFNAGTPAELISLANKMLEYTKLPQKTRNIGGIDLARVQLDPDNPSVPHPEYIYPGSKIKINPPSNIPGDSTFSAMVLSVDRSLTDYLSVKFTVGESDPRTWRRQGSAGAFFDAIANLRSDFDFAEEVSNAQDEDIWEWIDGLVNDGIAEIIGEAADIQAVGIENAIGDPTSGVAATDHVHFGMMLVPYDAEDTSTANLLIDGALPLGAAMGYLGSSAGTDEGWWIFPHAGTDVSEWLPFPAWN